MNSSRLANNSHSVSKSSSSNSVYISGTTLAELQPAKSFNYHQGASITSLDFDDAGQFLISSGIDKSIQLYDCHKGTHSKDIQSQKYGAHSARFTHEELNCLYASTPEPSDNNENAIRYLSLSNNRYLRYFKGHKAQVSSIEVNPVDKTFLSSSYDGTVKLWDLKSSSAVGNLEVGQNSVIGFDPHGVVFAIGKYSQGETGTVSLYDLKTFDKAPFLHVQIPILPGQIWNKLEFSNNGKLILISTDSAEHYVLDSYLGELLAVVRLAIGSVASNNWMSFKYPYTGCCTFSPCGKYLLVGTPKSTINIYDVSNLHNSNNKPVILSRTNHILQSTNGIPKIVSFSPKMFTLATADTTVTLWLPPEKV